MIRQAQWTTCPGCGVRMPRNGWELVVGVTEPSWLTCAVPMTRGQLTVADLALAGDDEHVALVRRWATQVWDAWAACHAAVASFTDAHVLPLLSPPGRR